MRRRTGFFISFILCASLAWACGFENRALALEAGPRSWVDAPPDGGNLPVATMPRPWSPSAPGNYTLAVRTQNSNGVWGDYARAATIGGEPTPTPTAQATQPATSTSLPPSRTPTPTEILSRPTLAHPTFSARAFYWGDAACGPNQVTISVDASDPSGIASVQIHFRLASQSGTATTGFTSLTMDPSDASWTRTIDSEWDIPGYSSNTRSWWFQFYFTATNNDGVQAQSSTYENNIVLSRCVQLR